MYKITFLLITVVVHCSHRVRKTSQVLLDPATSVITDKDVFSDAQVRRSVSY